MTTDLSQIESSIVDVRKRDGRMTAFNKEKITSAIYKALVANGQPDRKIADEREISADVFLRYEPNNILPPGMVHNSIHIPQNMSCTISNKIGSMVHLNQRSRYFNRSTQSISI